MLPETQATKTPDTKALDANAPSRSVPDTASQKLLNDANNQALDSSDTHHTFLAGAYDVMHDVAAGAWTEITEHPGRLAVNVAKGAAVGAAALMIPELAIVGAVGAVAYGAYEVEKHGADWAHDVSTVFSPEGHSAEDVARAHRGIEKFGAGVADTGAAMLAGAGTALGGKALLQGMRAASEADGIVIDSKITRSLFSDLSHSTAAKAVLAFASRMQTRAFSTVSVLGQVGGNEPDHIVH